MVVIVGLSPPHEKKSGGGGVFVCWATEYFESDDNAENDSGAMDSKKEPSASLVISWGIPLDAWKYYKVLEVNANNTMRKLAIYKIPFNDDLSKDRPLFEYLGKCMHFAMLIGGSQIDINI